MGMSNRRFPFLLEMCGTEPMKSHTKYHWSVAKKTHCSNGIHWWKFTGNRRFSPEIQTNLPYFWRKMNCGMELPWIGNNSAFIPKLETNLEGKDYFMHMYHGQVTVHYVNELVMKQIKKLLVQGVIGVEGHTWLTRAEICYSIHSMLENMQLPPYILSARWIRNYFFQHWTAVSMQSNYQYMYRPR